MSEETLFAFQARAENHFTRKLRAKDRELARARRALRLEAAKLTEERRRARECVERLNALRESFKGKGPTQAHYIAIVALLRAQDSLGIVTT